MNNRNYQILIEETSQKQLYRKAVNNIRLSQLKAKADLEAELSYQKRFIGSPMPNHASYLTKLGSDYLKSKKLVLSLF